ncbi:hypothetical protein EVA_14756 [gut metagenome]|uniref:Uncharacterized protein n=1 Tax=gut metagenome TaxID=749906 RepID=J9FQC2_9ZZZZ
MKKITNRLSNLPPLFLDTSSWMKMHIIHRRSKLPTIRLINQPIAHFMPMCNTNIFSFRPCDITFFPFILIVTIHRQISEWSIRYLPSCLPSL